MNTEVTEPAGVNNFGVGVGKGNDIVISSYNTHISILRDQRSSNIKKSI